MEESGDSDRLEELLVGLLVLDQASGPAGREPTVHITSKISALCTFICTFFILFFAVMTSRRIVCASGERKRDISGEKKKNLDILN